jgi:hypothetical protein
MITSLNLGDGIYLFALHCPKIMQRAPHAALRMQKMKLCRPAAAGKTHWLRVGMNTGSSAAFGAWMISRTMSVGDSTNRRAPRLPGDPETDRRQQSHQTHGVLCYKPRSGPGEGDQ